MVILKIVILIALFYLLAKAADAVVVNLRKLGERLGINIIFLGLLLGAFTSLPELAVGVNAVINGVPAIAFGNLMGGIIVLFGLVLGVSIVVNREIKDEIRPWNFAAALAFLCLPLLFASDGRLDYIDGAILIFGYFVVLLMLYFNRKKYAAVAVKISDPRVNVKNLMRIAGGVVALLVVSNLIIRLTTDLLARASISYFAVGAVVYAIGTNLPEISVAVRAWRDKLKQLSFSHLLGSAMSNILIVGILVFMKTLPVKLTFPFWMLSGTLLLMAALLAIFYKTGGKFDWREGLVLLAIYFVYIAVEIFFQLEKVI